jgi:hypothetical protein
MYSIDITNQEQVIERYEEYISIFSIDSSEKRAEDLAVLRKIINARYPWYWAFKYSNDSYWISNCLTVLMGA